MPFRVQKSRKIGSKLTISPFLGVKSGQKWPKMVKMTKKGQKRPFFGHFFALFPKIFVKKPKSWSEVGRIIKLHSLADTLAMPTT